MGIVLLALAALLPLAAAAEATVPRSLSAMSEQVLKATRDYSKSSWNPPSLAPRAGMKPVYSFVLSAKRSVDMTMYELADMTMLQDLITDRKRGVEVRVIWTSTARRTATCPATRS